MKLSFHGATGTVTGSRYLLEVGGLRLLVDCGLFQGYKQLRLRNWSKLPFEPSSLDAVLLTHAHIDHSGYLPRLVRDGFRGPVYASEATRELCKILLPDSGYLQEADAAFAKRHGFSKHREPLPLYTEADGRRAAARIEAVEVDTPRTLGEEGRKGPRVRATWRLAGHILGACSVVIEHDGKRICFSGDLGRPANLVMEPPAPRPDTEWLVLESTYGDRLHERADAAQALAEIVRRTIGRGGTVLVPAFAVGRTQELLVLLTRLREAGEIPEVPIIVDSPMATSVTALYRQHRAWHRLDEQECVRSFDRVRYARTPEESKALDRDEHPKIIVSASGMATGGRVVHHLARFAPERKHTILFTGFQAGGTRGASIVAGAEEIKMHGGWVPVRAEVQTLEMLSAHADADELMQWLRTEPRPPRAVFVTHGEPAASDALRMRVQDQLGWEVSVPAHGDVVHL